LDYEAKQKQLFELSNPQQPTTNVPTSGTNLNPQLHIRQAADALVKLKRQGSSSTLLSDQKAQ
jgi:hypothetical protein